MLKNHDDLLTQAKHKAQQHSDFMLEWTDFVFQRAFMHGYKHGVEDVVNSLDMEVAAYADKPDRPNSQQADNVSSSSTKGDWYKTRITNHP